MSTGIHGIGGQARTNQFAASSPDQTQNSLVRETGQALYILISDDLIFIWMFFDIIKNWTCTYTVFQFMWSVYYYRFYQPCFTTLFQKADKCSISQENQKSQKRWYTALLWWNWAKNVIEYFICEQKYLKLYSLLQNITVITLSCWISIL